MRIRSAAVAGLATALLALAVPPAHARSKTPWTPNTSTSWTHGAGGDNHRSGYARDEARPAFFSSGHLGTNDDDGPWLEWQTKISDLPSGIFLTSSVSVANGRVFVGGGSTNSFLALDGKTGLPIWRFTPDQRVDGYTAQYPSSNSPTVADGLVFTTFSNGYLYALDERTGRKVWSYRASDVWQGGPLPPGTANDPLRKRTGGAFDPIRAPIPYPKIHGVTAYCSGKIYFMTLSGYAYGFDAKTGRLLWNKYVDNPDFPGEMTWYEYKVGGALKVENKSVGSSTRRFEAVPGLGCIHDEVSILASDGHVRFLDPLTGKQTYEYDRTDPGIGTSGAVNFCESAGWNCDGAIGQVDPNSGDYLISFLDGRLVRLDWRTHQPVWRRSYEAPLPFQVGNTMPLALPHVEHGFITEATIGGPMAEDVRRKILYAGAQDGHIYAIDLSGRLGGGLRPSDPSGPTLVGYTGVSPNTEPRTPYTRPGEGGPWDYNQMALSALVFGGDVLYAPTWDNRITAFRADDPTRLRKIWTFQVTTNPTFRYPPFGDTFKDKYFPENGGEPFSDLDNKILSAPALVDGHLYVAAGDGSVYNFNLRRRVKTVKNLVILGSGDVPFIPKWEQPLGEFDRVWTPADWYKNQVAPSGYRFPKPAGVATAAGLAWLSAGLWWWMRRREELGLPFETAGDDP